MRKINFFIASLFSIALTSCVFTFSEEKGNGDIEIREWEFDYFDEVELTGNYDVVLIQGEHPKVSIETDENLFDFIEVHVRGGKLDITSTERLSSSDGITVEITYGELERISAGGATELETRGQIQGKYLRLDMAGAGLVDLELDVLELDVTVSGAGAVNLWGKAEEMMVEMSGAGDLKAYDLTTKYCNVEISGIGSAEVFVTEELEARVSGVGGVKYKGNPSRIDDDVSGLGKIMDKSRDNM